MKRIFVHIGTHKTGTTSIQAALRKHAAALAGDGILVPTAGTVDSKSGHHNLAWEMMQDERFRADNGNMDDAAAEILSSDRETAVLSAEGFSHLVGLPERLTLFDERLRRTGLDIVYLCFFRKAETYAPSLFGQLDGLIDRTYSSFVAEILATGRFKLTTARTYFFSASGFKRTWERMAPFGLQLSSYEAISENGQLLPSFFRMIGASETTVSSCVDEPVLNGRKPAPIGPIERRLASPLLRARFGASRLILPR